jgi:hypothetical protein
MRFTSALKALGFQEVPQEPYIVIRDRIIYFFFIDDVVLVFRKDKCKEAE